MADDLTYDRDVICQIPAWDLAFVMSEIQNDNAPIGWSKYIPYAECLLATFDIKRKVDAACSSR